jgi:hypothetical protein
MHLYVVFYYKNEIVEFNPPNTCLHFFLGMYVVSLCLNRDILWQVGLQFSKKYTLCSEL